MFVISWQTLNTVDAVSADAARRGSARSPASSSGRSTTSTQTGDEGTVYTQLLPNGAGRRPDVPAGRTIQLYLESPDVIHAFYVPQFLFKRDVVPGRTNIFEFTFDEARTPGQTFHGQCAELCGTGHNLMLFDVHAMAAADFDAWLGRPGSPRPTRRRAPPPSVAPGASGEPGPSGAPAGGPSAAGQRRNIAFDTDRADGARRTRRSRSSSTTRTPASRTTSRSTKAARPGPRSSRARSSRASPRRPTTCRPLQAGTYGFVCSVHPTMTGTLTVH